MKNLVDKYKPRNSSDIPQDLSKLKEFIIRKKSVLLNGPTGSCKTSAVHAIAKDLDYEILELNASDLRNKDQIEKIIGEASKQISLFHKEKIILMDEGDGLSGEEDRGGASALANILKETTIPIIITANDAYSEKLKEIKKVVTLIDFPSINSKKLMGIIKDICIKENIEHNEEDLRRIAINSSGDLRAALNDLESCTINKKFQKELLTEREYEINILNALSIVFKTKSINANLDLERMNIDLNEYSLWLDENLPLEYKNQEDLITAYNKFSRADIFKKRITRWQYWRFLYYQNLLLTSGISLSKSSINTEFTSYKRTMRLLKIWQSNMRNAKTKSIAEKLALYIHTSKKNIVKNFKYYRSFLKDDKIINEIKLTEEEIEHLNKFIY